MSNNKHLPCLQDEESGSAVDSVRSYCIEDADSQDRCVRSAFIGTGRGFQKHKINSRNHSKADDEEARVGTPAKSSDLCESIYRKQAADNLLSMKNDKMFIIPSMEIDAFGEYLQNETGSRVALEFYLACQAIKTIPDDDEFLRKSVKSMYRLFVRKYMKTDATIDADNYVSMETLRKISEDIAVKKIGSREMFEPAAQELSYVIDKHFKNYLASKGRLDCAENNQGRFRPNELGLDTNLFNCETDDDINALMDEHCSRVFEAPSDRNSCNLISKSTRPTLNNHLSTLNQSVHYKQADFCRSVSTTLLGSAYKKKEKCGPKVANEKRYDDRLFSSASKRTISGVHKSVLPHSKSVSVAANQASKHKSTAKLYGNDNRDRKQKHASFNTKCIQNKPSAKQARLNYEDTVDNDGSNEGITVVYYMPGESIPFMTPYSGAIITLDEFKRSIVCKRLENCKFFFKTRIDMDECQVVYKEISDPNEYLPLFKRKIIAKIERFE
ncbi:hypothetical protein ACOME3_009848 [Neoechinorhynchus agilis]